MFFKNILKSLNLALSVDLANLSKTDISQIGSVTSVSRNPHCHVNFKNIFSGLCDRLAVSVSEVYFRSGVSSRLSTLNAVEVALKAVSKKFFMTGVSSRMVFKERPDLSRLI